MRTIRARLAAVLSALLLAAPVVSAQEVSRHVIDDVGFFSEAAKGRANLKIAEIKRLFKKDLVIEAAAAPKRPAEINTKDEHAVNTFFDGWAQRRYSELGVHGVYVVIVPEAKKIRVEVGDDSQAQHYFTKDDRKALVEKIRGPLKDSPDEALLETVNFVEARMKANHAAAAPGFGNAARGGAEVGHGTGGSGWGTLWTILGFVIVGWIVFAVIRALLGMGRGSSGYGAPGYGGGGGGGFMSSMLGGLFGAAAGMYLYNQFLGHGNSAWGAGGGSGSDAGGGDTTASGGGADYGDSPTGGDWGTGDNGGGGDAGGGGGGGGDWGTSGGDWGGGGGGDWGGGGGGGGDW